MGSKGSANRQRIVDAADHLFYSRGYNQTSFSDISDETGIPRGNFYYYFKTKEEILSAVVDARLDIFKQMLSRCEKNTADPMQRLQNFVQFPLNNEAQVLRYGCPIGSLSVELVKEQDTDLSEKRLTAVFDLIRDWIRQQMNALGLQARSADLSLDLLAKLQGTLMIANIYNDAAFLHRGIEDAKLWLRQNLAN